MTHAPVSTILGRVAAMPFIALKRVRPQRPIHSEGVSLVGTLTRTGGGSSGIGWIDEAGQDRVRARFSRSLGLPRVWPDILGLAVRICAPDGRCADDAWNGTKDTSRGGTFEDRVPAGQAPEDRATHSHHSEGHVRPSRGDILLATAGEGRFSRFVPTFHRRVPATPFASFMPYHGERGPVLIAAHPEPRAEPLSARAGRFRASIAEHAWVLGLYWATPLGPWQRFGTLELRPGPPVDETERFDPIGNLPAGAANYTWTRNLREPSYALARTPLTRLRRRAGQNPDSGKNE